MTAHLAITLGDDQKARLDALASAWDCTASDVVLEAVGEYLAFDNEFRAAVQQGLAAMEAGDVFDFDAVASELRSYAVGKAKAERA